MSALTDEIKMCDFLAARRSCPPLIRLVNPVKASVVSLIRIAVRTLAGVSTLAGANKIGAVFFRDENQSLLFYDRCVHACENCRINIFFPQYVYSYPSDSNISLTAVWTKSLCVPRCFYNKKTIPRSISPDFHWDFGKLSIPSLVRNSSLSVNINSLKSLRLIRKC